MTMARKISVKEIRVVSLLVCALTGFFASSCWGIANGTHGHHGETVPVLVVLVFQPYNWDRWKKRLRQLGLKFHFKAKLWQLRFSSAWDGTSKTHTKLHCSYRRWRGTKGTIWKQKKRQPDNRNAWFGDVWTLGNPANRLKVHYILYFKKAIWLYMQCASLPLHPESVTAWNLISRCYIIIWISWICTNIPDVFLLTSL